MPKTFEIRDPIHGFITVTEWEKTVIDHPAFQRLRRIRQLGLSELIYPGTTHTRFEHSLGVMHIGTKMFDQIVQKCKDFLCDELYFNEAGLKRDRTIVRFACLLHDIGHSPFSHAGEEIMPVRPDGKHYKHEDYSSAIIRIILKDVIENHPDNQNLEIKADNIADMIEGSPRQGRRHLWHNIVSSQLDADRSDYLLRDSYYAGVSYGHFDLNRILNTLTVAYNNERSPVFAIEEGGKHAAEALIIARYMMFWQVYFQKTRRICDYHATEAVKLLLKRYSDGRFPIPKDKKNLEDYLDWDDYKVFGEMKMKDNRCGRHADCLFKRNPDRCVYESPMVTPSPGEKPHLKQFKEDDEAFETIKKELGNKVTFIDDASASWYRINEGIPIYNSENRKIEDLSSMSQIIPALMNSGRKRIYVKEQDRKTAKEIITNLHVNEQGKK